MKRLLWILFGIGMAIVTLIEIILAVIFIVIGLALLVGAIF